MLSKNELFPKVMLVLEIHRKECCKNEKNSDFWPMPLNTDYYMALNNS